MAQRFAHRFVVVTETAHIVRKTSFSYRSYPSRRDAYAAADRIEARGKRAYVVDQENPGHVILP
jgi:hypothetical protein